MISRIVKLLAAPALLAVAPAALAQAEHYSPVRVDLTVFAAYLSRKRAA